VIATRTRKGGGKLLDRGSMIVLWVTITLSITAGEAVRSMMRHNMFPGAHWLGHAAIAVLAIGIVVRWTAIVSLGKAFSVNVAIRETQTLYQGGLYRFMRHPSYTGMLIIFFAIGLSQRNWYSFAIMMIFPTIALLYRIHVEEAALNQAFGDAYAQYSQRTKRLIPGIY
jgi:protein-S-isoprenylcysteine O-methyltransferase Ste14